MISLRRAVICACIAASVLCGCASSHPDRLPADAIGIRKSTAADMAVFQSSSLMYLRSEPYKSICLEVNATTGAEPTETELQEVAQFLEKHCHKPVTVTVKKDLPAVTAEGPIPTALATQHMAGPPDREGNRPAAYVYLLFFKGSEKHGTPACTLNLYPCGAIVNVARLGPSERPSLVDILKHECGHILGLCRNSSHGNGVHCSNDRCLMQAAVVVRWSMCRFLVGKDPIVLAGPLALCDDCIRDLQETRQSKAPCTTQFHGHFLVRKEQEYFVATLPSHLHLGLGSMDIPWEFILEQARKLASELPPHPWCYSTTFSCSYPSKEERLVKQGIALDAALKDHDKRVVRLARELKKALEAPTTSNCQLFPQTDN